ncbi:MAG: hypothetical protein PUA61_00620 [Succinatimonas hippei]|nr:hypothetical protein [Succinatimonas hippei]
MLVVLFVRSSNTVGRTGIDACGESAGRRNSSEYAVLFSLKQEAPASIGGTFTLKEVQRCCVI